MEENNFKTRLESLLSQRVMIETKGYHVGYLTHKGILVFVGEDYIELDCGNKAVVVPISEIRLITLR